jgi:flagellar M-ring protein FliF
MTPDQISIVGTDGRLLAGGGQSPGDASSKLIELEQNVAQNIQENVRRTLTPYFGPANFEVSALARLNIDKRQSTETAYDPDKRVERSVRVVKEAENSQNGKTSNAVGVEQNIPNESTSSSGSDQNRRAQDRKEETTNYEISSKSASTVSDGYRIENISVALVVNRKRIGEMLGKAPTEDEIKSQIAMVEKLVQSAAGLDTKRGDRVDIAAVDFAADALDTAGSGSGWTLTLLNLAGTLIKSLTVLLVAAIIVWAGFRPLMRALIASGPQAALQAPAAAGALEGPSPAPSAGSLSAPEDLPQMASPLLEAGANPFGDAMPGSDFGFGRSMASGPVERLAQLLEQDEEHAAAVLKHWIRTG